ncbi:MAG: AraC family transcriptional regulator [Saprospiraceae bacterium]
MLFNFNLYSSLLLPSFVHGLLFFLILMWRGIRQERLADKFLALILLTYTLRVGSWMLGFAGWYDSHDGHTTFMFYFPTNHWLAIGPLFYFYFFYITDSQFKWERRYWWHFLPEGIWLLRSLSIFMADLVISHWIKGETLPLFYHTHGEWLDHGWGFFDKVFTIAEPISIIVYVYLTLRLFRQYRIYILENFSDTGQIHFSWLRNILVAFVVGYLVWIAFDIADALSDEGLSYVEDWYSFFFLGLLIYYLSIAGFANGSMERPQLQLHFKPDSNATANNISAFEKELGTWRGKIESCLAQQKPHLQPDLSLSEMAALLNLSPPTLSKAINAGFQKNFNELINEYRVMEVKEKLADPANAHLTMLAIAMECGFSSKATFNRVFKKLEGVSPSEYMAGLK